MIVIIIMITSVKRMMVTMITQHLFCKIGALTAERRSFFGELFQREKWEKQLYCHFTVYDYFFGIDSPSGTTRMKKRRFNNA